METTSNSPMLIVEDAVNELHRLSSLCSIIIWMSDENNHPEINAMGDTVEVLRNGLITRVARMSR